MFWRMAGFSSVSPVETILDKGDFTLEELLDEDDIIQECRGVNWRLLSFLQEKAQLKQLIQYITEEPPEDAEKTRVYKLPFMACEIFCCEIDIILDTLVEDQELMHLLFSFLEPKQAHNTLLAGYFSKVVKCLLLRKTVPLMHFMKDHQEILRQLVDLIGITSIMEVLKRLIGTDEHLYTNTEAMQWMEETDILEMVADKFRSSDCPEVHANAAEVLCAVTQFSPAGLAAKISSPNFIGRLFQHALEDSRPKSVLVNSLSVCISLLDPSRFTFGAFHAYSLQLTHGSVTTTNPEVVDGMLKTLGNLLKLLDVSSAERALVTTYGGLHPPFGKHRLKFVEFVSVLLTVGSEAAEKELMQLGAVKRILDLFFGYSYNNFLHHHVENIILSCLESKNVQLLDHLLGECDLIGKILGAEENFTVTTDPNKPTVPVEGRKPPRIGNIGHLTRISNKLVQLANNNSDIQKHLQENNQWADWYMDLLSKRNAVENVYSWACGRPTPIHDQMRDSDDDDFQDRDYDVAALANNLSQAFQYGIYTNRDTDEARGALERDDEDDHFDDETTEVVISSLHLGDNQEGGSFLTNANWFVLEDGKHGNEKLTSSVASPSPNAELASDMDNADNGDDFVIGEAEKLDDMAASSLPTDAQAIAATKKTDVSNTTESSSCDKSPAWVEWRETMDSEHTKNDETMHLPNGEVKMELKYQENGGEPSVSSTDASVGTTKTEESSGSNANIPLELRHTDLSSKTTSCEDGEKSAGTKAEPRVGEQKASVKDADSSYHKLLNTRL